jgi:hypothetical protein
VDVGEWLKSLGLERYEATFRENDVDAEVLPDLTANDLKEIGITSFGHRRQLLEAGKSDQAPEGVDRADRSNAGTSGGRTAGPRGASRASRKRMSGTEKHLARGDIGHLVYHPIARGA